MLFAFGVFGLLRDPRGFARLYRPVSMGRYKVKALLGRRVLVGLGALVIVYGAVITVIVSV
jgi:hypothetical protein